MGSYPSLESPALAGGSENVLPSLQFGNRRFQFGGRCAAERVLRDRDTDTAGRPERGSLQCGQEGISGPIGAPSAREISCPVSCEGSATAANREAAEKRGEASLGG